MVPFGEHMMMSHQPSNSGPSGQRSSWRQEGSRSGPTPSSQRLARWSTTGLVLILLGLLGWLLVDMVRQQRLPHTYVVTLLAGESNKVSVPSIPYAHDDLMNWKKLSWIDRKDASELQQGRMITQLGKRFEQLDAGARDPLIVYVSAHGISQNGRAYLLGRDFDAQDPDSARYHLDELLAQLQRAQAPLKLLVLDAGWMVSDVRLGMVVNEFPILAAQRVAQLQDPNIWVLLSHSPAQTNGFDSASQRSLFGHTFAEALAGAADQPDSGGDGDRQVTLGELYRYVAGRCSTWSEQLQIPLLFHAGQTIDALNDLDSSPANQLVLAYLPENWQQQRQPPKESKTKKTSSQDPASKTPASKKSSSKKSVPKESAKAKADSKGSKTSESAADSARLSDGNSAPPARPFRDQQRRWLHAIWTARDQLQKDSQEPEQWQPAQYAPHLWRELNRFLIDCERQCRAGSGFDQQRLLRLLEQYAGDLQQLVDAEPVIDRSSRASTETSLVKKILLARQAFVSPSGPAASFKSSSPEHVKVGRAVRTYYLLSYRASDYVHWHGRAASFGQSAYAQFPSFTRSLHEWLKSLREFQAMIGDHSGRPMADGASIAADFSDRIMKLSERSMALDQLVSQMTATALNRAGQPRDRRLLESLLGSPLPTAAQRDTILDALRRRPVRSQGNKSEISDPHWPQNLALSSEQWKGWKEQVTLEYELLQLIDAPSAANLKPVVDSIDRINDSMIRPDQQLWEKQREVGRRIQTFYAELPNRIGPQGSSNAASPATARSDATRWLRFVDGRDAERFSDALPAAPRLDIRPPRGPQQIMVKAGKVIDLSDPAVSRQRWQAELTVPVGPATALIVTPQFSGRQLTILSARDSTAIVPGKPNLLPIGTQRRVLLDWTIVRNDVLPQPGRTEESITLNLVAGNETAQVKLTCPLPVPDYVDLVIEPVGPSICSRQSHRGRWELRPFPNRSTNYRFQLVNGSTEPKKVKVQLVAVPQLVGAGWARGQIFDENDQVRGDLKRVLFDSSGRRLLPGVKVIAATNGPMDLPADGQPHEIAFPDPKAAAAGEPPMDEKKKSGVPPTATGEPARQLISDGLLCVITDLAKPGEPEWQWIEVNPLKPLEFLKPTITYRRATGRVDIDIKPLASVDGETTTPVSVMPADLAQRAVEVIWDIRDSLPDDAERNDRGVLTALNPSTHLYAIVPPKDGKQLRISLHVDDYPRAFIYLLDIDRDNEARPDDPWNIRLRRLEKQAFSKVYLASRDVTVDLDQLAKEKRSIVYLETNRPAVFPARRAGELLTAYFQVDAPRDAFARRTGQDVIALRLDAAGFEPQRFYADRQMNAWIDQVSPGGAVRVTSQVDDYVVSVNPRGLKNRTLPLVAEFRNPIREVPPHQIAITLDSQPPSIKLFRPKSIQHAPGQPVEMTLQTSDLSGLSRVQFGLVAQRNLRLDDKAPVLDDIRQTPGNTRQEVTFRIDTKELKPGDYWAKAIVTDHALMTTECEPVRVTILDKKPEPKPFEKGTIFGVVKIGALTPNRITVRLKDTPIPPQKTSDGGKFRFENVDAGQYTLIASGYVRNQLREGEVKVELMKAEDDPLEVEIPLK